MFIDLLIEWSGKITLLFVLTHLEGIIDPENSIDKLDPIPLRLCMCLWTVNPELFH